MGVACSRGREGVEIRSSAPIAVTKALQEAMDRGRLLVGRGEDVLNEASYADWREARRRWFCATLQTVSAQFEAEAVDEFLHANKTAGGTWEERLREDLRATRNAVELVHWLGTTLNDWRQEPNPYGYRDGYRLQGNATAARAW